MNKIPSINLADFLSNDESKKQKFINEIGHAYENIGFVALKGHFLNKKLVDSLYAEIKNFFDLPTDIKEKYEIPGIEVKEDMCLLVKNLPKEKKKEI